MDVILEFLQSGVLPTVLLIVRVLVPLLALYVVWRCYTSFKKGQQGHNGPQNQQNRGQQPRLQKFQYRFQKLIPFPKAGGVPGSVSFPQGDSLPVVFVNHPLWHKAPHHGKGVHPRVPSHHGAGV